jgi:hypothetical protein
MMEKEPEYWQDFLKWQKHLRYSGISSFDYEVAEEGIVIKSDVVWEGMGLEKLPFPIARVEGSFSVKGNLFKVLEGFPKVVTGSFNASFNQIEDPAGCPQSPRISLTHNNLAHCKLGIERCDGLWISHNPHLSSLEGAPSTSIQDAEFHSWLFVDATAVSKEDKEIYRECQFLNCWSHKNTILENLGSLIKQDPKLVEKDWKLLEKLDSRYKKYFFGANMGLL